MARKYTKTVRVRRKLRDIPKCDRPREKMLERGPQSLSNLELVTVLLSSGSKERDVFLIAQDLTNLVERSFEALSIDTMKAIKGVGIVKACQIMAAIEFSRRFLLPSSIQVKGFEDVLPLLDELRDKKQEYFLSITLDGGHHVIEKRVVFMGTLNESLVHPREIFVDAVSDRAAAIIIAHNHTSIDSNPSEQDILVTNRMINVGRILGIEVLDHIIVTKTEEFSFRGKGLL